ncbi:MAG: TlpA family protein disulfide reductase [Muribaculum sp.]|nr:TlpA family protein disulfide reductase [Muribaculum sp.]
MNYSFKIRFLLHAIAVAVTGINAHATTGAKIINPDYDSSGSLTFSVRSIELTDSSTVLNVDVYSRKGSRINLSPDCYLSGGVTGSRYPLTGAKGIHPGENLTFSDSTYLEASLCFGPLTPADSTVSFIEPGGWNVIGLKLKDRHDGHIATHISGTVNDYPDCSWLVLLEAGKDFRISKNRLIPVRNGEFSFDIYSDAPIVYELSPGIEMLRGSWSSGSFFSDGNSVEINITPEGCTLADCDGHTSELKSLKERYSAFLSRKTLSEGILLDMLIDSIGEDAWTHPEVKQLKETIKESIHNAREEWLDTIAPLKSLSALYMLTNNIHYGTATTKSLEVFSQYYSDTLTNHPYHKFLSEMIKEEQIVPGNKFIDFTAPDPEGNHIRVSDVIKGKIAVIDLWASWCGPCRRHSISMIPLYEKYHDRGFEIIGVARENGNVDAMLRAIKNDGYLWPNLVELNDRAGIWVKYGAGNAGGKIILVNREGTILEVNPDISRIEEILIRELGD